MDENDKDKLESLEPRILDQIYGQDNAVKQVVQAVQMAKAGLIDENKPLASLLFVGPTGVGKTEVARVLARELGVELVRFDMSEYVEKHTVAKLIGSPAGYVGYDDGGLLTDAVRKHPDCVLLLDEIEKAHNDIFNLLLQVMDYGTLSDNKGRKAVFRNVVLIMTSNAGAQFAHQASVGFASTTTAGSAMVKQVKKTFKPEFINRIDEIIPFSPLGLEAYERIADNNLCILKERLFSVGAKMDYTKQVVNHIAKRAKSKSTGARGISRLITSEIENKISKLLLSSSKKELLIDVDESDGEEFIVIKANAEAIAR
jgi:ATP-dependent Clp protease ATP-binding subunit ClpA